MKAEIKLIDGVAFNATTQSGHTVTIDGALEGGGQNKGPRPMEMLLVGLGGCTHTMSRPSCERRDKISPI